MALPCPGSQPGPPASCSSLSLLLAGKPPFWEGLFPKEQFHSACYKRLKNEGFLKCTEALWWCAEPRSSSSSGSGAGMGLVAPLPPPLSCNLPSLSSSPQNHIFLHSSSLLLEKNGLEVHGVGWAGGAGCCLHPKPAILEQLWLRPAQGAPASHKPKPALNPSILLRSHQRLWQAARLCPVLGRMEIPSPGCLSNG